MSARYRLQSRLVTTIEGGQSFLPVVVVAASAAAVTRATARSAGALAPACLAGTRGVAGASPTAGTTATAACVDLDPWLISYLDDAHSYIEIEFINNWR